MNRTHPLALLAAAATILLLTVAGAAGAVDWPRSSDRAVRPLDHPTIETLLASGIDPSQGYRFVVFGDQRAQDTWPGMMERIAALPADPAPLFMLDTGDIVADGRHADQFSTLAGILAPCSGMAYLVGIGNHELSHNQRRAGRENTGAFLSYLDADFGPDRMYYAKVIGPLRFLFLDSNDLVYGDEAELDSPASPPPGSRAEAQMIWLADRLAETGPWLTTVAVMHHPFVQSSKIHRDDAAALWSYRNGGETLPNMLIDGGVEVVLVGHTHTYERFDLTRADGDRLILVNISGKPGGGFGAARRRARDLRGREIEMLRDGGWEDLEGWTIVQREVMDVDDANQFAVIDVDPEGGMTIEMHFLDRDEPSGLRIAPAYRIP